MILEVAILNVIPWREWKRWLHPFYDPFPTVERFVAVDGIPNRVAAHS